MFKLKRLKIEQYRNVKPGTELRFDDGPNLILGQNASGKTTLLALLSAVCRSVFEGIADEEFALEYELHSEQFVVCAQVAHRRLASVDAGAVFGAGPRWDDDYVLVIDDRVSHSQTTIVSSPRPEAAEAVDPSGRTITSSVDLMMNWSFIGAVMIWHGGDWMAPGIEMLRTFSNTFRFDESLDCFLAMTGRSAALAGVAGPPPARAGFAGDHGAAGKSVVTDAFVPQSLVEALLREYRSTSPGRRSLDLRGTEHALFPRLTQVLDVQDVSIFPNLLESRLTTGARSFLIDGFTFEIIRADGTTIHHDRLSYGQKRLLSFLYYLECNPYVAVSYTHLTLPTKRIV